MIDELVLPVVDLVHHAVHLVIIALREFWHQNFPESDYHTLVYSMMHKINDGEPIYR